jgi:hypothetical protein
MNIVDSFSQSYARARSKFLEAAALAGANVQSHIHPLLGRDGESLAMDVVLDGSPDADKLLIVTSACHGVEGFCGSGVQVFALHDAAWRARAAALGVAVLYVHGLNPYGFSHIRRVTHENVDINRNFQDFSKSLPANPAYSALHPLLLPEVWPPSAENQAALDAQIARMGMRALQAAITSGQHEFAGGLFFGGTEPTWSNRMARQVLRDYGAHASRIAWIDIHTGLGASGVGERICACKDDPVALARARAWWDSEGRTPVTSIYDGSSTSALLTGLMWNAMYEECAQAEYTGIALEYGTLPMERMIFALRAEQWLQLHPQADAALALQIKQDLRDMFYVDTDLWKTQVMDQAQAVLAQAVQGLSSST